MVMVKLFEVCCALDETEFMSRITIDIHFHLEIVIDMNAADFFQVDY